MIKSHKILIANPYGIGDVILTLPLVRNCRLHYPQAKIYYMGNSRNCAILRNNPDIDEVIVYDRDSWHRLYKKQPSVYFKEWYATLKHWRSKKFDMVVDFTMNISFGFLWVLAGIPLRIGYDYKNRGRFLTHRIKLIGFEGRHIVDQHLELLSLIHIPIRSKEITFNIPMEDQEWAQRWLEAQGIDMRKPIIGLVPGGGASWGNAVSSRRWPVEKYAHLADKVIEELDAVVILMGDQSEGALATAIKQHSAFVIHSAIGQTTIMQMAALMSRCKVVVANDGGPMHISAASGTTTVAIFGPVDHEAYGPYPKDKHQVVISQTPCQPCYRRFRQSDCQHQLCLKELSVEKVWQIVDKVINHKS